MNLLPTFRQLSCYFLLTVPLLAGLATLQFETGAGFTISGVLWVLQLFVGLFLLVWMVYSGADLRNIGWLWPWGLWCGWIFFSLTWCDDLAARNVQEATQLSMPMVIGLIAAMAIRSRADLIRLWRAYYVLFAMLACFALIFVGGLGGSEWLSLRIRPNALAATIMGCMFLAAFPGKVFWPLAGWSGCLLFTFLTGSRMAAAALLVIIVVHPGYRSKWRNVGMIGVAALVAVLLFNTSVFQQRFFREDQSGTLEDVMQGEISSEGRFEAWPLIWEKAWQRPLLGAGAGSAYEYVPIVWENMNYIHNDYLRIGFELGLVGLGLFAAVMLWQLAFLYRRIQQTDGIVQTALTASWLGFWAMLTTCTTDNTLVYNVFFMNPLFAILGSAVALAIAEQPQPMPVKRSLSDRGETIVEEEGRNGKVDFA